MVADVVLESVVTMSYFAYVVECANGSLYTGWTTDLDKRIKKHNVGAGAKYTRAVGPVKLLASWEFESKNKAMSFEWYFKQLRREAKLRLLSQPGLSPISETTH
jgi:putative endonuclease